MLTTDFRPVFGGLQGVGYERLIQDLASVGARVKKETLNVLLLQPWHDTTAIFITNGADPIAVLNHVDSDVIVIDTCSFRVDAGIAVAPAGVVVGALMGTRVATAVRRGAVTSTNAPRGHKKRKLRQQTKASSALRRGMTGKGHTPPAQSTMGHHGI